MVFVAEYNNPDYPLNNPAFGNNEEDDGSYTGVIFDEQKFSEMQTMSLDSC